MIHGLMSVVDGVYLQVNFKLNQWAKTQVGMRAYCVSAFASALEIVPYTLAENAGT